MIPTALELFTSGYLSRLDFHFARTLEGLTGESQPLVGLAAAVASRFTREGHVCVELQSLAGEPVTLAEGEALAGFAWPDLPQWRAALQTSRLSGGGDPPTPLVLEEDRLYLWRYWDLERRLARQLRQRAGELAPEAGRPELGPIWRALFPDASVWRDDQSRASLVAACRLLAVITGGPGTGKTYTVRKILDLLLRLARHAGQAPPRVLLLAPTGKAAARLAEVICGCGEPDPPPPNGDAGETRFWEEARRHASTIHRALGVIPGKAGRFRHGPENPLPADMVVVDEASMVDLALMTRLVEAVPPMARLILLGDRHQLCSVETGSILGDIYPEDAPEGPSAAFAARLASLSGEPPTGGGSGVGAPIRDCLVELVRNYRFDAGSGIGRLARAINAGDPAEVRQCLAGPATDEVQLVPGDALERRFNEWVQSWFRPFLELADPSEKLAALGRFRILCAHRQGPRGAVTLNRQVEAALARANLIQPGPEHYAGRPVLVTANDYQLRLFNGDLGLICRRREGEPLRAWFAGPGNTLRDFPPARLAAHETVFAMTVHKSQGSEFETVLVVLPDRRSPVLTRELLYTAVTRARRRVLVAGPPDVIAAAVEARVQRASGLRQKLWSRN